MCYKIEVAWAPSLFTCWHLERKNLYMFLAIYILGNIHLLKGRGYGFFRSQNIFFSLSSAAEKFFRNKLSWHYFLSTKTIFIKAQCANRIFFFAHFTPRIFFPIKFADRKMFSPKTIAPHLQVKWMFPYLYTFYNQRFNKIEVGFQGSNRPWKKVLEF